MQKSESVLVCFALKEEAVLFRKIAAGGLHRDRQVSILITGVGRKNAEKSLREFLATNSPDLVLTCGFAGGLNPNLKLGDVVFELMDRRSELPEPQDEDDSGAQVTRPSESSPLREKLIGAGAKPAKFFCADRIATTVAEKKKLRDETLADAVEMESWAIYTVCRERKIPYATVRVISDTAAEDLPLDFNQLSKSDMHLHYGKLARALLLAPWKIGALMELQKKTRFAAQRLTDVLAKLI
jgi:adenosylhomocysteine nucleosidase